MPSRRMCQSVLALAASAALAAACLGEDPEPLTRDGSLDAGATSPDAGEGASRPPSGDGAAPSDDAGVSGATVACSNGQECRVPNEVCCADPDGSVSCTRREDCTAVSRMECDSRDDCPQGQLCCGSAVNGTYFSSSCAPPTEDGACAERPICRTSADCPDERPCSLPAPDFFPQGFRVCD